MAVDKKALNLELLELAGFTCVEGIWSYPDGVTVDNGVPFFPKSFDECIEWILPLLNWPQIILQPDGYCGLTVGNQLYEAVAKTPALAFCLAVKELINAKE